MQFAVFLMSLVLVLRFLLTGQGADGRDGLHRGQNLGALHDMITGSIWEREVFGRYLFARAFFWEDVFSILVLALHTAYLFALFSGTA